MQITKITQKLADFRDRIIQKIVSWLLGCSDKLSLLSDARAVGRFKIMVFHGLPDGTPDLSRPVPEYWSESDNFVVDVGRQQVLKHIFGITDPAAPVSFPYLGVGDDATAIDQTDSELANELDHNANTRKTLQNVNATTFDDADIVAVSPADPPYLWKVIGQVTYLTSDLENGYWFREFGIFSTATCHTGLMYNRFLNPSPFEKSASLSVIVQLTLRA